MSIDNLPRKPTCSGEIHPELGGLSTSFNVEMEVLRDGRVERHRTHNHITDAGLNELAGMLMAGPLPIQYVKLGTSGTPPGDGDRDLLSPVFGSPNMVIQTGTGTLTIIHTTPSGYIPPGTVIREEGVYFLNMVGGSPVASTMYARAVLDEPITITGGEIIRTTHTLSWTVIS